MRGATMPLSPGVQPAERERVTAGDDHAGVGLRRERQQRNTSSGTRMQMTSASFAASRSWASKPSAIRLLAGLVAADAHERLAPAVAQVQRPRPALIAVADDRDPSPAQRREIGVVLVEDRRHRNEASSVSPISGCGPVTMLWRLPTPTPPPTGSSTRMTLSMLWTRRAVSGLGAVGEVLALRRGGRRATGRASARRTRSRDRCRGGTRYRRPPRW